MGRLDRGEPYFDGDGMKTPKGSAPKSVDKSADAPPAPCQPPGAPAPPAPGLRVPGPAPPFGGLLSVALPGLGGVPGLVELGDMGHRVLGMRMVRA